MAKMNLNMNTFGWANGISLEPCVDSSRHNFVRDIFNPSSIR